MVALCSIVGKDHRRTLLTGRAIARCNSRRGIDQRGYILFPTVVPLDPIHLAHSASSPSSAPACTYHARSCPLPVLADVLACSAFSLGSISLSGLSNRLPGSLGT